MVRTFVWLLPEKGRLPILSWMCQAWLAAFRKRIQVRAGRLEEAKAVLEDTKRRKLYNLKCETGAAHCYG